MQSWESWGDPSQYKRSDYWDTQAGKDQYGNYDDFIKRMRSQSENYLNGNNPLSAAAKRIGGTINNLGSDVGGFARFSKGVPMPNDPLLGGYMSNIRGEQLNDIGDMTRGVAGAGVAAGRGGFGVAGGSPVDSLLRQGGMNTVARGAADRYRQAMDYGTKMYGNLSDMYKDLTGAQINALSSAGNIGLGLAGQEKSGLDSRGMVYDARRQDFGADQAAQQAWQAGRQQRTREELDWEQQQRDAQYARQQMMNRQSALRKATYGAPNASGSPWQPWTANQEWLRAEGVLPYTNSKFGKTANVSTLQKPGFRNLNDNMYGSYY